MRGLIARICVYYGMQAIKDAINEPKLINDTRYYSRSFNSNNSHFTIQQKTTSSKLN